MKLSFRGHAMSNRLAIFTAGYAMLGLTCAGSAPAVAQSAWGDGNHVQAAAERALREGAVTDWQDGPAAGVTWHGSDETAPHASHGGHDSQGSPIIWESREVVQPIHQPAHHSHHLEPSPLHAGMHGRHGNTPQLAYGPEERAEWLAQCRALRVNAVQPLVLEERATRRGGLIGGLLGAVTGGIIGNRVADDDRLLGTIIGAGVGGFAGAVISSVIDENDRRRDERRASAQSAQEPGFDYCEAYLLNYERGYGVPGQIAYAPVAMVPVLQHQLPREQTMRHRIIEEGVEVDMPTAAPERRTIRRAVPARQQGKLVPAN